MRNPNYRIVGVTQLLEANDAEMTAPSFFFVCRQKRFGAVVDVDDGGRFSEYDNRQVPFKAIAFLHRDYCRPSPTHCIGVESKCANRKKVFSNDLTLAGSAAPPIKRAPTSKICIAHGTCRFFDAAASFGPGVRGPGGLANGKIFIATTVYAFDTVDHAAPGRRHAPPAASPAAGPPRPELELKAEPLSFERSVATGYQTALPRLSNLWIGDEVESKKQRRINSRRSTEPPWHENTSSSELRAALRCYFHRSEDKLMEIGSLSGGDLILLLGPGPAGLFFDWLYQRGGSMQRERYMHVTGGLVQTMVTGKSCGRSLFRRASTNMFNVAFPLGKSLIVVVAWVALGCKGRVTAKFYPYLLYHFVRLAVDSATRRPREQMFVLLQFGWSGVFSVQDPIRCHQKQRRRAVAQIASAGIAGPFFWSTVTVVLNKARRPASVPVPHSLLQLVTTDLQNKTVIRQNKENKRKSRIERMMAFANGQRGVPSVVTYVTPLNRAKVAIRALGGEMLDGTMPISAKVLHKYISKYSHCNEEPIREPGEHPDTEQAPPWVWTWPVALSIAHLNLPSLLARRPVSCFLAALAGAFCSCLACLLSTFSEVNHLPHPSRVNRHHLPWFYSMLDFLCQPLPAILNWGRSICGEFFLRLALGERERERARPERYIIFNVQRIVIFIAIFTFAIFSFAIFLSTTPPTSARHVLDRLRHLRRSSPNKQSSAVTAPYLLTFHRVMLYTPLGCMPTKAFLSQPIMFFVPPLPSLIATDKCISVNNISPADIKACFDPYCATK
ncbi:uncharacterized protein CLUP02_04415 [Colletotrichum lupini]|uniref:Uncharacterized protein n=1 Tax=Colletotrichum lupini TaxID=145971 RepID=A0A9Q8WDA0_9PEZI|nr:uncharacterized protein CLUP02_04415 [Colletotrichum lupini]UQC78936.1 hypothetical protein CLUP02_04415 [Colletotrichum lupini]